ncbi:basement membrane-specific heparan sulfate proteoglycan core protein isoform X3 [Plutella xylostella]|uniref:basement membrane-specific heparan sulfate proteoglycan core protein isoform X3 n=1 Tax=Plutella xylostella TaxID=51655 RepID=UPI002032240A|nr:basement membrane-specific heparan sulfate proteoglycan core protein isoform X3 [Plutella xylostella]
MSPGRAPAAMLLLLLTTLILHAIAAEDIYWEGEEDAKNEYLEVKDEGLDIGVALRRLKRQASSWFDKFNLITGGSPKEPDPGSIDSHIDEDTTDRDDDELDNNFGSGAVPEKEPELKEKTLRVSFVAMEPYQQEYSDRDSKQFQNLSKSLADAVNLLFEELPGTQRAALVRIQSLVSDEFSCKVTLDIVTAGYEDTDRISDMLRNHIREKRKLGSVTVSDTDFSATSIDPDVVLPECPSDEFQCGSGQCVPLTARCDRYRHCPDGADEQGCEDSLTENTYTTTAAPQIPEERPRGDLGDIDGNETDNGDDSIIQVGGNDLEGVTDDPDVPEECREPISCVGSFQTYCPERKCDGVRDCPRGDDELDCPGATERTLSIDCPSDMINCDATRCILKEKRCDGIADCNDGSDEAECDQSCGSDDFRCDNGKCIAGYKRCDHVIDCSNREDEANCDCGNDEFRCISDGTCIEKRKVCDGTAHCSDGSDEESCSMSGYFRCRTGKFIPERLRCNGQYDCPIGDYSDEKNCPCGEGDFKCDNGYCIPSSKHCDRTNDCQDGSDERNCEYADKTCMASEYECSSGECVQPDARCNGTTECLDGSDESHCPCKRDEFRCTDGSCINIALRCDGNKHCRPLGEDEINCGPQACPDNSVSCDTGGCGVRCDGIRDCDGGEDEELCTDEGCNHYCDDHCLDDSLICNGNPDCRDGSDEAECDNCDGPTDFRCHNGECIKDSLRCNSIPECSDGSDEENCANTIIPVPEGCNANQYQCRNGLCIDKQFVCDGQLDCTDNSDELSCPCSEDNWACRSGQCIPRYSVCDGIPDCPDQSDESACATPAPDFGYPQYPTSTTPSPVYTTTGFPIRPPAPYPGAYPDSGYNRPGYPESGYPGAGYPGAGYPGSRPGEGSRPGSGSRPGQGGSGYPDSGFYPGSGSNPGSGSSSYPGAGGAGAGDGCNRNEWRCENGPCISSARRCDGHVDCPYDDSDELDCPPDSPVALNLKTYPKEQTVRYVGVGGDVVFQCRDEGPQRAPVRWIREGGRPLKPGSTDRNGRLEMFRVSASDSGTYVCQATKFLGYPGSELKVVLTVDTKTSTPRPPPFFACKPNEATCGNGQCIPKSAVCDGKRDCTDGADEDECQQGGFCEPNQYQCRNRRCVLKTWLCDSEDDCGDGSDEENCGVSNPGEVCLPIEFSCRTDNQCIPKSFHCDGHNDCFDNSDELGCAKVSIRKPPLPQNVRLQPGDTLTLTCAAVGVPTPLISWRLNWGHVPTKCRSTSIDGVGTLTCPNIQPEDSGAYSCEAINNKGTAFAAPDSIVFVNRTSVCPSGYFNSEANSARECVRCFCFGESTQCKSADLFTYNMPTPLGEGGTRLTGVKASSSGEISIDSQPITELYWYQPLRNGAAVTKLETYASSQAHPYITLPESYNGNQLTSYGGYIKYRLQPHSKRFGYDDNVPDIIIKGKHETILHYHPQRNERDRNINARLVPTNWMKADPRSRSLAPATREDIMMALDNVETILLRSDLNGAGANITDFTMESAQLINVGLGAATLVEECQCPPGYEGLSCQKCAAGHQRQRSGPWLGNCVKEERPCEPGTYGDPQTGCRPCPCPLTNRENNFARTCSLGPNGVVCDCMTGYEGANCEVCSPDYIGNPLIPGDSCKPRPTDNCNPVGTLRFRLPDQCECKENVRGQYCDQCNEFSFYLSEDFRHGCAQCFCSGVTQECRSSGLRRKTSTVMFNVPDIVSQVKVYNSTPVGPAGSLRYNAPVETDLVPIFTRGEIALGTFDRSRPTIYYWSLPISFAGDKVTSYGGFLRYTLRHVPSPGSQTRNNAADVQLISDNRLTFHYFGHFTPSSNGVINGTVQFLEKGWQRSDGKEVQRESLLLALADVKTILIKATYTANTELASLVSASIDTAEYGGNGPQALHVEECVCPAGYLGTSCEDCAPGYTRSPGGLYLGLCRTCECNGRSDMCDPESGVCYDCADNTDGDNCENCKPGYERDRYDKCVPSYPEPNVNCNCDPRGTDRPCEQGRCICKQNVEGDSCDRCRPGTFGLDASNPDGCIPCYCSGATKDCHEGVHYTRVPMPAPIFGENYGGYAITNFAADSVVHSEFVPAANESELMYVFTYPPNEELYWSLPVFPGNRVLSYGGNLSLTQRFNSGGYDEESEPGIDVALVSDDITITWSNPIRLREGQSLSYKVPLTEDGWYIYNTATPANRNDFMNVLKNLRRVLVKATVTRSPRLQSTSIADVSMDTAFADLNGPPVKGVEVCMCPPGFTGTSCESCTSGYYKDLMGTCRPCSCNGNDCQLGPYGNVVCNCRPPYTGRDCSSVGLVMELHPTLVDDGDLDTPFRTVAISCKYRAPEPLTIQFYYEGQKIEPPKYYNESRIVKGSWTAEHEWTTTWDMRHHGHIVECHTVNRYGSTLGMLTSSLPEPAGASSTDDGTTRPPPPQSTVTVRITSPTIKIQDVGGSVNFTCQAQSRYSNAPVPVTWKKADGYLPLDRTYIDEQAGLLRISNVQVSDSGRYICYAYGGISMEEASVTLRVPGNDMTLPTVNINPAYNEYSEGDRIELECLATGNPMPRITWQRASNRALPLYSTISESRFIIERAFEEDSGEYRCIATNQAGSMDRTAVITVRPRQSRPQREKLTISPSAVNVGEGQSTRVVCTGSANIPSGSIGWTRQDGGELTQNVQSDNGVLYIDGARAENQGVYICQASSSNVAPVPVVVTVILTGTPPPSENPNVTVLEDRIKIPTGGNVVINCIPSGQPLPLITWKKHESKLGPGTSQRDNTLVISQAREEDQGYYLCEGTVDNVPVANVYVFVEIERREPPVVEIWPQAEQAVPLGAQFEFRCQIKGGIPEPYITWDRNGGRQLSPHVQIQPQNVLSFEKVEVNDEGEYTCTARNDAGTSSASAVLKVRSPPKIVITPKNDLTVADGDQFNIECRASGYPEPLVSIRKDPPTVRTIVPPTPGIAALRVASASNIDDGSYTCVATSAAGTLEESFIVRVLRGDGAYGGGYFPDDGGSGEEPDVGIDTDDGLRTENLVVADGQDTSIYCNASDDSEVQWSRERGQPLQSNARQNGNELRIIGTSRDDSGYYECTITNRYTGEPQQMTYTMLQVMRAPRITLRPPTQTVYPGQSPTVECQVDGDDILEISWKPVNRPFSRRVEARHSTLIFHQIEVEDAGQYECFAKNRIANVTGVAEVKVNEELSRQPVESHDNEQFAHVGAGVHLSCNVSGRDLRTRWTKDGRPLPRTVRQKQDGSLFIGRAQKSDSGHYVCVIQDPYGRQTVNYINLHIEGRKCLKWEFRCYDDSDCIGEHLLCDGFSDCADSSDEGNCMLRDKRLSQSITDLNHIFGSEEEMAPLVEIEQPRRQFRVGENVDVLCRMTSRDTRITWERLGTNQFVETTSYGDGSRLRIAGVEESDAGVYRCTGRDLYNRVSSDDFNLEVIPGQNQPSYPDNDRDEVYTARIKDTVNLPCKHNLEPPVSIEWRKEYVPLSSGVRNNEPNLHLERVTELDAGTYICRVSNSQAAVEARAILRVIGVVPSFDGSAWLSLPKIKDAYSQLDIELSLKPTGDMNGLVLYNSEKQGRTGDFIALQLVDGVPQFNMETGNGPIVVRGDRPLQLNTWHTIRINSINGNKVTMDVDNTGPFVQERSDLSVLDLDQPLYIGGVPTEQQLPEWLGGVPPFIGCVSMLILGREEVNMMMDKIDDYNVKECETCSPNLCYNNGVCQEARNEHGYTCLCPAGFAGQDCSRTGEACRPGLCGPGKCTDTNDGFKCSCPVTYTGKRCEIQQSIEYPAFTGNAFLAVPISRRTRFFRIAMKVKASSYPIADGIIMYCAESPRGYGAFTSLAVRNGRLEFRYDLGDGSGPIVLTSSVPLQVNKWSDVILSRVAKMITMEINNKITQVSGTVTSPRNELILNTPLYIGGYDESIVLNNNTGVRGGFSGCIKDVSVFNKPIDIVNKAIKSENVQECNVQDYETHTDRGDIPENEIKETTCFPSRCRNGGFCRSSDAYACTCQPGFSGQYCEHRASYTARDPCRQNPCVNGGTCRRDFARGGLNYTCDCPLGFAGAICQMSLQLVHSVGFQSDGYMELPGSLLYYDKLVTDPAIVALAIHTTSDGVLLYQREVAARPGYGDFILLRVENGKVVFEWDLGGGTSRLVVDEVLVTDGERHQIIAKLSGDRSAYLSVDEQQRTGASTGFSNIMSADSNIYIGGIPDDLNVRRYPGLSGCFDHVELMSSGRGLNLGEEAVTAKNARLCRN